MNRSKNPPGRNAKRILIVKFGAIGDVLMAVPAAHALHLMGYAIEWVCGRGVAPLLAHYPWIKTFVLDDHALIAGTPIERLLSIWNLWRILAVRRYALCATLYYDSRYRVLSLPVLAKRRLRLSPSKRASSLMPGRHHTDEYLRVMITALFDQADGERPSVLAPVPMLALPATSLPAQTGVRRIILSPAGARNSLRDDPLRRWPLLSYVELARMLLQEGHEVVLIGGPDDRWAVESFKALPVVNTIGTLSLTETLALLDSGDVFVTHDTGPLHLAGVTGVSIVSLFGPTDAHTRFPRRHGSIAIWGGEGFACRPCYDGRDYASCGNNGCIQQVTVNKVSEMVQRLLDQRVAGLLVPPEVVLS